MKLLNIYIKAITFNHMHFTTTFTNNTLDGKKKKKKKKNIYIYIYIYIY